MSVWEEAKHPREKDGKFGNAEWASKLSDAIGGNDKPLTQDAAYHSTPPAHTLPGASKPAIRFYTGGGYRHANNIHRYGPERVPIGALERTKESSAALDHMFNVAPPLPHSIQTYRGVDYAHELFGPVGSHVGKVFQDKGFVSTTSEPKIMQYFGMDNAAHMTIHIPKGNKVLRLEYDENDNNEGERELLLPRGSRFKVISDTQSPGKMTRHMVLELLP